MCVTSSWRQNLYATIRSAEFKVSAQEDIKNEAQAHLAVAVSLVYGDSATGYVYIEPCTARSTKRPPDMLLCQPDVDLLVFEVRGHEFKLVQSMEASTLFVREGAWNRLTNLLHQAEESMSDVEDAIKRVIRERHNLPLFSFVMAIPNIPEPDWSAHGFNQCLLGRQLLIPGQALLSGRYIKNPKRLAWMTNPA
jgi:hypothetical protein